MTTFFYIAEHEGNIYGLGFSENDAIRDAHKRGLLPAQIPACHVVTIEQAKRISAGEKVWPLR